MPLPQYLRDAPGMFVISADDFARTMDNIAPDWTVSLRGPRVLVVTTSAAVGRDAMTVVKDHIPGDIAVVFITR